MIHIPENVQVLIKKYAERSVNEVCGAIFTGPDTSLIFVPILNVSTNPKHHYIMWPELLQHVEENLAIENVHLTALYHSHNTGDLSPSEGDTLFAFYPELIYLIGNGQSIRAWHIIDERVTEVEIINS